jgi:hypothetical protein
MIKPAHALDWLTLVLLAYLVVLSLLNYHYPKRFSSFLRLPFSKGYFTEIQQEKSSPIWFTIFLDFIWIAGFGLFGYLFITSKETSPSNNDFALFVKTVLIALLTFTLQRFFHSLTGVIFEMKKPLHQFIQIKDGYLQWTSLLLVVLVVFYFYSPLTSHALIYIGIGALSGLYIIGILRASKLAINKNLNGLQLFFYLCVLEILPVLTILKIVIT